MDAIALLETIVSPKVLGSGLLLREHISIPVSGATDAEIAQEEAELSKPLSEGYRRFLRRWNGINLDVIRLYGAGEVSPGIQQLKTMQLPAIDHLLAFATDPAGFVYAEDNTERVVSFDHDGGEIAFVARDFDAFIVDFVFGKDSAAFMGDDWQKQLSSALPD